MTHTAVHSLAGFALSSHPCTQLYVVQRWPIDAKLYSLEIFRVFSLRAFFAIITDLRTQAWLVLQEMGGWDARVECSLIRNLALQKN